MKSKFIKILLLSYVYMSLKAAILHDTVEDTNTTFDELESRYGKEVRDIVSEVTDDKRLPKLERKRLQILHAKTCRLVRMWLSNELHYLTFHDFLVFISWLYLSQKDYKLPTPPPSLSGGPSKLAV